uniref:Uncharacterized protein n=1 Tax=Hucho hucho TaxID=62062 RepID=A0A4W5S0P0_9TELE
MIQSSHPSSLKLTCRAFLLHLDFDFLPCLFPCRLFNAVLRRRLALNRRPLSSSDLVPLSWRQSWLPWRPVGDVCKSPGTFLNILNSAPTNSSLSERVETSNRYFCLRKGECKRSSATVHSTEQHTINTLFPARDPRGLGYTYLIPAKQCALI